MQKEQVMNWIISSVSIALLIGMVLPSCAGSASPEPVVEETLVDIEVDFNVEIHPLSSPEDGINWVFSEPSWIPSKNPFLISSESGSLDLSGAVNAVFWEFNAIVEQELPDGTSKNGNLVQFPISIELSGTVNLHNDIVDIEAILNWSDPAGNNRFVKQYFQGEPLFLERFYCVPNPPDCDGFKCGGSCPNIGVGVGVPAVCKVCVNLLGCGCAVR
jgi:hypothetical protein